MATIARFFSDFSVNTVAFYVIHFQKILAEGKENPFWGNPPWAFSVL